MDNKPAVVFVQRTDCRGNTTPKARKKRMKVGTLRADYLLASQS